MTRRALPLAVLLILLLGTGAAAAAPSATRAKEDLRELRGRIEALQKRISDAEESKTEAADALKGSERAISDANRKLHDLAQQSLQADRRLAGLRAGRRDNETALQAQQALLERLLYQQYLDGRSEPLKLLLNRENPNQIARQMHYFSYISRARADLIGDLRTRLAQLDQSAREVEAQAAEIASIAAEQTAQKRRLEQEKRARGRVLARISTDIRKQKREIGTLKRDENRLSKLVEQLGRIISRTPSRSPAPRLRNERLPDNANDGSPFQALKGKLHLPVRGELANRFGSPRLDSGLLWKGLFIAAKAGEEVRAIASGRVVFADWLRGFGNLLIIDHGAGYMSLYGYNETLYKRVGDALQGGETIATVGNSGGNADSGLYFEIRYQGKPFDPLTWVTTR
ncbi:MAG TPA: peptidoglycan DD-metalloendopeptidase family protein [Burkholderiales bacterium]|nr:peptidoglycan DD-metalloendopeptidase family protein [Burkholderiales bacterium]